MPIPTPAGKARPAPAVYRRRRPERTLLYRLVQTHLATWLALHDDGQDRSAPALTGREFRRYLECGILAHGFARARCAGCGHDFIVAYSCKGRGVCPSCTTRRMAETAAHLVDHVFPCLPVRQWVLSFPKRLRYHLDDAKLQSAVLHSFLRCIEQGLRQGLVAADGQAGIGAVVFIHRTLRSNALDYRTKGPKTRSTIARRSVRPWVLICLGKVRRMPRPCWNFAICWSSIN